MRTTLISLLVAALLGLVYSQQLLFEDPIAYRFYSRPRRNINLFTKLHRIREGAKRFDPLHDFIDYA